MAYSDAYWLANDAAFKQNTLMAMVDVANNVSSEDPATAYHAERAAYATLCLRLIGTDEDQHLKLAYSVAMDPLDATIAADSPDADFYNAVSAVWNAHAGVVTTPE